MQRPRLSKEEETATLLKAADIIEGCFRKGGKLLICGNGGSAADASHMAGELVKSFEMKRPLQAKLSEALRMGGTAPGIWLSGALHMGFPAVSLASDGAVMSAISNDIGADAVFAQQVVALGREGDCLLCISTSGESSNVMNAALAGRAAGMAVIGLIGGIKCSLAPLCDMVIAAGAGSAAEVQSQHQRVYHEICRLIESRAVREAHR